MSGSGDDVSGSGDDVSGSGGDVSGSGDDVSGNGDTSVDHTYHYCCGRVVAREKLVAHFIMDWCPLKVVRIESSCHHNLSNRGSTSVHTHMHTHTCIHTCTYTHAHI